MSPSKPSVRRVTKRADEDFDPAAANRDMTQKLQRNALRRRARKHGLELRHSTYGYSLVDGARERVDGRSDLTLDEVAKHLDKTFGGS